MAVLAQPQKKLIDQLRAMSTDQLKQELTDRLGLTAESLLRTACLVAVLEERGEDLSGLKIGLIDHLRKIALGTLLPEIVVRFAGNGRLIRKIGELGIAEQRRILSGERPEDVLRLESAGRSHDPAPGHVGGNARPQVVRDREEEKLSEVQRPESVVPKGAARDVAEYLFRLVLTNDDPAGVMTQLDCLFAEYRAGGKRQRIVLESVGE